MTSMSRTRSRSCGRSGKDRTSRNNNKGESGSPLLLFLLLFPDSSSCFLKVKGIVFYYSFHFQKDEHGNENENENESYFYIENTFIFINESDSLSFMKPFHFHLSINASPRISEHCARSFFAGGDALRGAGYADRNAAQKAGYERDCQNRGQTSDDHPGFPGTDRKEICRFEKISEKTLVKMTRFSPYSER